MQAKFNEINEMTRISAIKFRTFASDEKAAKFRCFYCSDVGEISQVRCLIETKFRGMRRNFVPVGRNFVSLERSFASTKRNFVSEKRNIVWKRRNFASTKLNFVFQEFVADYRIAVIITSCKSTGTCKSDHYLKKETSQRLLQLWRDLDAERCCLTRNFFYFFLNIICFKRLAS